MDSFLNEIAIMSQISHKYIVKLLDSVITGHYIAPDGTETFDVRYLLLEFIPNGTLFDYVTITGYFEEVEARYFFQQIIQAVAYLNENGIYHRDLKLDNIMMDSNFNVKIGDFGLSTTKATTKTITGTKSFMAPEMIMQHEYHSCMTDIYSAGVILFMMLSGSKPCEVAHPRDQFYKYVCTNDFETFWEGHGRHFPEGVAHYSPEFREFFQLLCTFD